MTDEPHIDDGKDIISPDAARARNPKLWELIEVAAKWATTCFKPGKDPNEPSLVPAWMWENAKGERGIIATPFISDDSKTVAGAMVRHEFEERDVVRYVFTSEVWARAVSVEQAEREEAAGVPMGQVSQHYDRREYIMHAAEDASGGYLAARHPVLRQKGRKPILGPLEPLDWSGDGEGRFANMLRVRSDAERMSDLFNTLYTIRRMKR